MDMAMEMEGNCSDEGLNERTWDSILGLLSDISSPYRSSPFPLHQDQAE